MKKLILVTTVLLVFGVSVASAQANYCFENAGLKSEIKITFTVSGSKVTDGKFVATTYDESEPERSFDFTGTKSGSALTIAFAGEKPVEFDKIAKIVWTLGAALKVTQYGKNYETNKWGTYVATYEKCE